MSVISPRAGRDRGAGRLPPVRPPECRNRLAVENLALVFFAVRRAEAHPEFGRGLDRDEAVSAAQAALLRAAELWADDGRATFAHYALRAINNRLARLARGAVRRRKLLAEARESLPRPSPPRHDGALVARELLARLHARHRAVVEDFYFEGMTHREIGAARGISAARVGQIIAYSLEVMRRAARRGARG